MLLDIHQIILSAGSLSFSFSEDISDFRFESVVKPLSPLTAEGSVCNSAGRITLKGTAKVKLLCRCDRCGEDFEFSDEFPLDAVLALEDSDDENSDLYLINGDCVDIDEIVNTAFVLGMESKMLCRPDCKGLCDICGANLNHGKCSCKRGGDPRLAVLAELLDDQ